MNQKLVLLAAIAASLLPVTAFGQASPLPPQTSDSAPSTSAPAAAAAPAAPIVPQAYPAKIALIAFEQCVIATNEGQQALAAVQKKYEPKQTELKKLDDDIVATQKKLQGSSTTLTDAERASLTKSLDGKQKQLDRDTEDARTAYQADLQEAYGKVAQKVNAVLVNYVEKNGYTLLLDVGSQQSSVMWAAREPSADITEAVVNAYNTSSGVAPPPPAAPSATKPASTTPKPAATKPASTTPKPAATKPPSQ